MNSSNTVNSTTGTSTQSVYAGGGAVNSTYATVNDAAVTTFVQQLDVQGPAVVQRVSTQLGDLACSQDTVQSLVEALHTGKSVTITANGQSSTFNAEGAHMGYGEAYLALAMAGQELRDAGVSSCATPEQWHAVLLGGPLQVTNTSSSSNSFASASGSRQVQGIVTLRNQGQGWGQIAQSNNIQLGQIVNRNSNVSLNNTNANSSEQAGAPTGFSSSEMNQGRLNVDQDHDKGEHKGEKKHWWSRSKDKNKDNEKNDTNNDASSSQNSSSTHADNSSNPSDK
jgi:hypothetical protein